VTRAGIPEETRRTLRQAVIANVVLAAAGLVLLAVFGQPRGGLALAAGLALGSLNGPWAARSLGAELGFAMTSLARLAILTAGGVAVGFALGAAVVWLAILGLALAQLVLAGAALRGLVTR
jgi:hypothetical protein